MIRQKAVRCFMLGVVLAAGTGLCGLPVRAQNDTKEAITWNFARKEGEVFRFRLHQTLSGELPDNKEFEGDLSSSIRREVKSVSDTGDATIEETTLWRKRIINGNTLPEKPAEYSKITQVVTKVGLLRQQSINGVPLPNTPETASEKLSQLGAMLSQIVAPDKPIAVGDTWKMELPNRLLPGQKVTVTSKLERKSQVAGVATLHISFSMDIPPVEKATPLDTMEVTGTYDIDPREGSLMLSDYKVDNVELPLATGTIKVTSVAHIERIVPGVNDKTDTKAEKN